MIKNRDLKWKLLKSVRNTKLYVFYNVSKKIAFNIHLIVFEMIFSFFPIKDNKIVFSSFNGTAYNAQPKLISDSLKEENVVIVWILQKGKADDCPYPTAHTGTIKSIYELMTANVWVDNSRKDFWIKKRKDQLYIQTWHGPVCLKAIEKDAEKTLPPFYVKGAIQDSKNADFVVSETNWRTNNIKNAFWYDGKIIKGEFKKPIDEKTVIEQVKKHYSIDKNEKVLLYAPTFRESGNTNCYLRDFEKLIETLERKTKQQWKVIVRTHPNVESNSDFITYNERVLNGTKYHSADDLIVASDLVITDYSGIIFESYRAKKVVLLYASDINEYISEERNMYFDIKLLPSPLSLSVNDLINNINSFDIKEYEDKRERFVNNLGYYDDDATIQCRDIIIEHIKARGE